MAFQAVLRVFEWRLMPCEVRAKPEVRAKADIEEDDGLGEWGRRRRSMSNPEKPMAVLQKVEQALDASTPSEGSERRAEVTSEDTGLLQRLLSAEDLQERGLRGLSKVPMIFHDLIVQGVNCIDD